MKLVIQTQYKENYGTSAEPYWKFKGGSVYVVENLTASQAVRCVEDGIPTLTSLIQYSNPMSEEYIVGYNVVEDNAVVCDEWESPTKLAWVNNRWTATTVTENDEYGYMVSSVARKIETYDMLMGAERENYTCTYVMRNGDVVKSTDIEQYLKEAA
jgi:hypothetical protein